MKSKGMNRILILLLLALIVTPLLINKTAEYSGVDGAAKALIKKENPNFEPWFSPLFEPQSSEIESLLFASQAAMGAGFIAYFFGLMKGRRDRASN